MSTSHQLMGITAWLRLSAMGALAGAVAGAVAGLTAVGIENLIIQLAIAKYGNAAVDSGYNPLRSPGAILTVALLGAFVGLAYAVLRTRNHWLGRWRGAVFATLVAIGFQPLLAAPSMYFSANVTIHYVGVVPNGFVKSGDFARDLLPVQLEVALMAALVFSMGLLTHHLLALALLRMPRLPAPAYALIAGAIGLPATCLFGLLFLLAIGAIGGE